MLLLIDDLPGAQVSASTQLVHTDFESGVFSFAGATLRLREVMTDQLHRRSRHALPEFKVRDGWSLVVEGFDADHERVDEALVAWPTVTSARAVLL